MSIEEDRKIEKILKETETTKKFHIPWYVRISVFLILVARGIYLLTNNGMVESGMGVTYAILYSVGHFLLAAICVGKYIAALLSWPIQRIVSGFYGENDKLTKPPESVFQTADRHIEEGQFETALKIYENLMENYPSDSQAYEESIQLIIKYLPARRDEAIEAYQQGAKLFEEETQKELWNLLQKNIRHSD